MKRASLHLTTENKDEVAKEQQDTYTWAREVRPSGQREKMSFSFDIIPFGAFRFHLSLQVYINITYSLEEGPPSGEAHTYTYIYIYITFVWL